MQVWEQGSSLITTYTRNASFEGNAGDTGYSINYSIDNPSITFNKELSASKNFQVIYQYIPPQAATGGDISQSVYGFDGSFKIGDAFKMDSSFARSETDQVYVAESTIEGFVGNGTKSYALRAPADIIEGSEKIYVNQRLLNKDVDYFISYTKPGQFNFYYITPTAQDTLSVEYNFQSQSGVEVGARVKADTAFRLGAETKLFGDTITANGSTKKIGFDFSPLGGTPIGVGSEYEEYNLNFKPAFHSFYTSYAYKFNKNPIGTRRTTFLKAYDNTIATGINPGGLAKIDLNYRTYYSLDDPLASGALHNSDTEQDSYQGSLTPIDWKRGALSLSQKYDFKKTTSKSDVVDRGVNLLTTNIDYYHTGGGLKFTDRFSIDYDYQHNEPITLGSLETETAHSRAIDSSYGFSLDMTVGFLQKWISRVSLLNHDEYRIVPTPETSSSTKNETYHMDIVPFTMLTGSFDHNRQERTSYILGGENPKTLRTTGSTRLTPFSWLAIGVNATKSEAIPETGSANKTTGRTKGYDIDYTPVSFQALKLGSRFASSDTLQTAPSGAENVATSTYSFSQNYTLTVSLIPILPLTFGFTKEDYKNTNTSVLSPVRTETQNLTRQAGLTFAPTSVLTLSGDYNQKVTRNLNGQSFLPGFLLGNFSAGLAKRKK